MAVAVRILAYPRRRVASATLWFGAFNTLGCAAVLALAGVTAFVGAERPVGASSAVFVTLRTVGSVAMVVVALVARAGGSGRRLGALLVALTLSFALIGLTEFDDSALFICGRIAVPLTIWLLMFFCLAYPDGRLEDRAAVLLLATAAAGFVALMGASLLLSPVPPVAGPFVRCSASACPVNPLSVINLPGAGHALSTALALWTAATLTATAALVARRVRAASRLRRRSLTPQLAWAVLVAGSYAFFVTARAIDGQARVLTPAAIAVAGIIAALPFAIVAGMAYGRVLAMHGLEQVVAGLGGYPSLAEVERSMSRAFADSTLRLLLWQPSTERYSDVDGGEVDAPVSEPGAQVTHLSRHGAELGAAVHDPALADERDVLEAVGSAVVLAMENTRLLVDLGRSISDLEASRSRLAAAADEERRRIEQDLHDGAQQRLIALRIKLSLLEELAAEDPESLGPGLLDAGAYVDTALDQIRNLAHGIYPSALRDLGIARALTAAGRESPNVVVIHADPDRRFPPNIEVAVYFCCIEGLQNVAKHCDSDARVHLTLATVSDGLRFVLADNGPGFDPALVPPGRGISGMQDRLAAIGGTLTVSSHLGRGTILIGHVPVSAA